MYGEQTILTVSESIDLSKFKNVKKYSDTTKQPEICRYEYEN